MRPLRWLLAVALFLAATAARADSFIWSISKNGTQAFLGGSIHILGAEDYPLPVEFDRAFASADVLVLETDMAALQTPSFAARAAELLALPAPQTLADRLKPSTLLQLEDYMGSRGLPMGFVERLTPSAVATTLPVLELQRLGLAGAGVDEHFSQRAVAARKRLRFLETAEQQLEFLASLGEGQEDEMILYTLRDMADFPRVFAQMKAAWRAGNLERMDELAVDDLAEAFPDVYETLIIRRNAAWLPQLEALFADPAIELVLVGAMHLVGPDGLLQALESRGYRVQAVAAH